MVVLVTGGAGYIGSHAARLLSQKGYDVVIYDNLSTGHQEAVRGLPVVFGDIADSNKLSDTIRLFGVKAIMHFAADSLVGESMANPAKYFENNVAKGIALFNQALRDNIRYIIFSSSAAVYGEPVSIPIKEEHKIQPTNTYGLTKCMLEKVLQQYHGAYGLKYISLRYFNAAGADDKGDMGEDHNPETHLIPLILQVALGQKDKITVFGSDYPTKDGTAIRDYVHVNDLAEAHILALEALLEGREKGEYNLGSEQGYTVLEVLKTAKKVTGKEIKFEFGPRRAGDPAVLIASSEKIKRELGWRPRCSSLEQIISTAWKWRLSHPMGFAGPKEV